MSDPSPPVAATPQRPSQVTPRAALPRELSDFLIELSIALHKHAMYPDGHPTLAPAAEAVARRLVGLLAERGTLSLGVAREQLIIEGVATDPKHPVLKELAHRLHRHHLGAVSFSRGLTSEELDDALKLVAVDPDLAGEPLGLGDPTKLTRRAHIRLYPLTFERLELVGEHPEAEGKGTGGRPAQLWVGLARAALAADSVRQEPAQPPHQRPPEPFAFRPVPTAPLSDAEIDAAVEAPSVAGKLEAAEAEPAAVAQAIESHERGTAYDQVIVGYLLQIAAELKTAGGAGAAALKQRISHLISTLEPSTLERLLYMGGDLVQRRQFVLDASQGMAVDAVLDLVKAATGTGAPVSNAMLRMLTKLGHHAERAPAALRAFAETELREQIAELVHGWELADPNPDGYARALHKMSQAAPTLVAAEEARYVAEPERIIKTACEADAAGEPVQRAVDSLIAQARVGAILDVLQAVPRPNAASEAIATRAVNVDAVKALLTTHPIDFALVDRMMVLLGLSAADALLDTLANAESRQVRRALIDRLARLGGELVPKLALRLGDDRWYVVRNLLMLASELPEPTVGLNAVPFRQHPDPRVRREAMRVLFRDPAERPRAICTALVDQEPQIKRLAVTSAATGGCPEAAVPLLVSIASDDEHDSELRCGAIRVLGQQRGPFAVDALLKLTERRRRSILEAMKVTAARPEYLAALAALGPLQKDRRVRERLEAALRSKDAAVAKVAADALMESS